MALVAVVVMIGIVPPQANVALRVSFSRSFCRRLRTETLVICTKDGAPSPDDMAVMKIDAVLDEVWNEFCRGQGRKK